MLKKFLLSLSFSAITLFSALTYADNPHVLLKTSAGNIELELYQDKAPISTKNFIRYVNEGFYNGLIFHRVIPNFMIQGGGFSPDMRQKTPHSPIKNEADNLLKNERGTIAMARTTEINSATSQFFINQVDNDFLNHSADNYGYAVFGKVVNGMDVVDNIAKEKTHRVGIYADVPQQPITIISATVTQSNKTPVDNNLAKNQE